MLKRILNYFRRPIIVNVPASAFDNVLFATVHAANPDRDFTTLIRRGFKLMEELGETAEALLNYTSAANAKKKTVEDIREEMVDVVVVAIDMVLTPLPGDEGKSYQDREKEILEMFYRKMAKWNATRASNTAATMTVDDGTT